MKAEQEMIWLEQGAILVCCWAEQNSSWFMRSKVVVTNCLMSETSSMNNFCEHYHAGQGKLLDLIWCLQIHHVDKVKQNKTKQICSV